MDGKGGKDLAICIVDRDGDTGYACDELFVIDADLLLDAAIEFSLQAAHVRDGIGREAVQSQLLHERGALIPGERR